MAAPADTLPPAAAAGEPPVGEPPLPPPGEPPAALPGGPGQIRIGLLLPLSGPNAAIGRALFDAAQLALFDAGDDRLMLLPKDTGVSPATAAAAAQAALDEGAELLIGPLLSGAVPAVALPARQRGVNVVSFSTDRSVAGDGVYLLGFTPEEQVEQVVSYARSRGLARFAALAPDNAYGRAVTGALQATLQRLGGELVRIETYPPGAADLTATVRRFADYEQRHAELLRQRQELAARDDEISRQALRRLEGLDTLGDPAYEAVLLPEGGARLKALAPLLPYYDVDPGKIRFLGTGLWDEPDLGREPALVGGWYAAAAPDLSTAFLSRFEQAYGRRPARIASLGYDAVALAAVLAKAEPPERFSRAAIGNPNGFAGYDGIFRFGADGVAERGLAVLEVEPRGTAVISPAPRTFEVPGQ